MRNAIRVFLLLSAALNLSAQEYRATLLGVVSDSSGARIAGAMILVTNMDSGVPSRSVSSADGSFVVPLLPPGRYVLRVETAGFKAFERSPIELRVADRTRVDATLELGQVSDQITVSGAAPLIEQANADQGQVMEHRKITDLPLNGGNPLELMGQASGANYTGPMQFTRPFIEGHSYSINGGRTEQNEFQIDGVSNNAHRGTFFSPSYIPPTEATQEFKIQTSTYDAQYGRTGGGVINVSIKSGGNKLHGAVYERLRRTPLEANYNANNARGAARTPHVMDQYGFEIDGPVTIPGVYRGRNRTFFMFATERFRESQPAPAVSTVPTLEERKGDFSKSLTAAGRMYTIYDPASVYANPDFIPTRPVSLTNLQNLRLPFSGNAVPANRMEPIAVRVLQDIPVPNQTGHAVTHAENFFAADATSDNQFHNFITRIDHSFNSNWKIYGRLSRMLRDEIKNPSANGWRGAAAPRYHAKRGGDTAAFDVSATLSPRTIFSARIGYNRFISKFQFESHDISALGFPKLFLSQLQMPDNYPRFTFENYTAASINPGSDLPSDTWSGQATLIKVHGSHTFKTGAEYRVMHWASLGRTDASGVFAFTRLWTGQSSAVNDPNSGNAIATFLMGYLNAASATINATPYLSWRYPVGFLQHDWQVSRRLSVNMGLRWDYETPPVERYNRQNRGFDLTARSPIQVEGLDVRGGLLFAGLNGQARGAFEADRNNFQPRFGVAWRILDRKPLVFRGGLGRSFLGTSGYGGATGFSQTTNAEISTADERSFRLLSNPFPAGLLQPLGAGLGLSTQVGDAVAFNYQGRTIPNAWQYSAGFQYELFRGFLVDASYVGNQTKELGVTRNLNYLTPEQLALGTFTLNQGVRNPFYGVLSARTSRGQQSTVSRRNLLVQYPQFTTVTMQNQSIGDSWYHSFQLKLERRFKDGFTFLASYTNSKNMERMAYLNPSDERLSRELVSYDIPQRLSLSGVYELPAGPRKRWLRSGVAGAIAGGWQVSWSGVIQRGTPMSYPDYYIQGDPRLPDSERSPGRWFNTSRDVWVQRPPDTLRVTQLRSPSIRRHAAPQISTNLIRNFRIREGHKVQFKASAFNVSNTPVFDFPNTTPTSPLFGVLPTTQINLPRSVELSVRYVF